ncbi:hypothetical protein CCP3SC1_530024 [Gammaproteobacteria bacterium]
MWSSSGLLLEESVVASACKMLPSERLLEIEATRAVSSSKLMDGGAVLEVTEAQIDAARKEMESDFAQRRKHDVSLQFANKFDIENIVHAIREKNNDQLRVKVVRTDGTEENDWVIAGVDRETEFVEVRQYYFDRLKNKNAYNRKSVSLERLKSWNKNN